MTSFKNITELELEKARLLLEIKDVENKIQQNWEDIKISIQPSNVLKQIMAKVLESKTEERSNPFSSTNKFSSFNFISNVSKILKVKLSDKIKQWIYA